MNDQTGLSEEKQKELALRAIQDITNLARLHKVEEAIIMNSGPMKDFIIAVYQAGAKMSMEEMDKIFKKTYENIKSNNPEDIPF